VFTFKFETWEFGPSAERAWVAQGEIYYLRSLPNGGMEVQFGDGTPADRFVPVGPKHKFGRCYIMNSHGATVDKIVTQKSSVEPVPAA
jgi:hypothetical protein